MRATPRTHRDFGPSALQWYLGGPRLGAGCDQYWVGLSAPQPGPAGATADEWLVTWLHERNASQAMLRTTGWPFRCLVSGRTLYHDETFRDWGMVRFGGPETIAFPFEDALPWRPIWIGLAANVGAHGLAWWVLLGGPVTARITVRAAHRRRRGLCPRCGYDLAGQREPGCPECGSGRNAVRP
jgi:hypothetical protein